jgi:HlyD family secretion protein
MQDMQEKLFRKVALERLSSPEQLDMLMKVITPKAWMALAPLLGMILLAIIWSWFGSIPSKVNGKCILINPGGLADVGATSAGRITAVLVHIGDQVKAGQEVARVGQPEMLDRIAKSEQRLAEMKAQSRVVHSLSSEGATLGAQAMVQQRQILEARLRAQEQLAQITAEREETQKQLLAQGLITRQQLLQTQGEHTSAKLEADTIRNQIKEISLRRLEGKKQGRGETASIDSQINEAERELDSLRATSKFTTSIVSPADGRVVEIMAAPGSLVGQGTPVLNIERGNAASGIEAVIYIAAADGKKVQGEMIAEVAPTTVKREEYGFMRGKVSYVSDYPATQQSMMLLLQNDNLVRELAGDSPPFEVRAQFAKAANFSGYEWSSASGAPVKVHSGTLCNGEIVVQRQRPISLVIPIIKKTLGVD